MSSSTGRREHGAAMRLFAPAMLLLAGCSGGGTGDTPEEFESRSQDLRCHDGYGNPLNDPDCPWKSLSRLTPFEGNNDISHRQSPALCAGSNSTALTITVDTSNRYRTLQWHWLGAPSWGAYGTKTFASKPACTMREDDPNSGQPAFVVAGKASAPDNKIYVSPGIMAHGTAPPQGNPTPAGAFTAVSNTAYSTGGAPALATGGFGTESIVMVLMGDDSRTIYAHVRDLPYLSQGNTWSTRITGPQLPSGWTAIGAPSIAHLVVTFQIVVHARNAFGQDRLFETHFYSDLRHFSNNIGSPSSNWVMLPSVGTIDGDPALTYSNARSYDINGNEIATHGLTVYFRRGTQIMQTSGPLGQNPVLPVKPIEGIQFASSPAAIANWAFESQNGTHTVIARTTSNQLYVGTSMLDYGIVP